MGEVILYHATGQLEIRANACSHSGSRNEPIGVAAEAARVDALELDAEVRGSAVVLGIETIRFSAGCGADLDHLYADSLQAVHHRLARGARSRAREDIHLLEPQCRQR